MQETIEKPDVLDPETTKKPATYSLPWTIHRWIKEEALRRNIDASALIVELVRTEQKRSAA